MSEIFDVVRCGSALEIERVVSGLLAWAEDRPPREGLEALRGWRDRIEVCRSRIVAEQQAAGASDRQVDQLLGRDTSRAERERAKKRARTVGRNRDLADRVDHGELSAVQLDALAEADAKTEGQAATDPDLLASLAAGDGDSARKIADRWVAAQQSEADLEARRKDQRKRRDARRGNTFDGLASLTLTGDDESVAQMWSAIVDQAGRLYRDDGGRDVALREHERTNSQRLFDAAQIFLTASGPMGDSAAGRAANASDAGGSCVSPPAPTIVVTAEKVAGKPDAPPAEMIGIGPIPDSLLNEIACGSKLVGVLFSGDGEVLWQGRRRRHPTRAQMLALTARDKGCVLCGAEPNRCQAHHLMPWSAPGQGTTDVDRMALVCQRHHRDLHERLHTLYRDRTDGRWKLRPATGHEMPKGKPHSHGEPQRNRGAPSHVVP